MGVEGAGNSPSGSASGSGSVGPLFNLRVIGGINVAGVVERAG